MIKNKYTRSLQNAYSSMLTRCYNPKYAGYKNYGGRGVRVCKEWVENSTSFYEWAVNNGYIKGLQLDKDIKGNGLIYSPETCCWATQKENARAKHSLKKYMFNDKMMILSEISELTGISVKSLHQRIHRNNRSLDEAIDMTPFNEFKKQIRNAILTVPVMETKEYKDKLFSAQKILHEIYSL